MEIKEHNCFYYKGKIQDITLRDGGIYYCRRCEKRLTEDEVSKETLNRIKQKIKR